MIILSTINNFFNYYFGGYSWNVFCEQYPFTGGFFLNQLSTTINDLDTTKFCNNFVTDSSSSTAGSLHQNTDHNIHLHHGRYTSGITLEL